MSINKFDSDFLPQSIVPKDLKSLISFGFFFGSLKRSVSADMSGSLFFYNLKNFCIPVFKSSMALLTLRRSLYFISKLSYYQSSILLVSSFLPKLSSQIRLFSFQTGQHFVNFRWIGGMLTNFKQVKRWIKRLYSFDFFMLEKFKYLFTLKKSFDGFKNLTSFPSCLVTLNTSRNFWSIKEANLLRIPVISLLSSSDVKSGITYSVLCNYFSTLNIKFFLILLKESFLIGKYSLYINNFIKK